MNKLKILLGIIGCAIFAYLFSGSTSWSRDRLILNIVSALILLTLIYIKKSLEKGTVTYSHKTSIFAGAILAVAAIVAKSLPAFSFLSGGDFIIEAFFASANLLLAINIIFLLKNKPV